jgi:hypothetical protein
MNAFRHKNLFAILPVVLTVPMFLGVLFGTVVQAFAFHQLEKSVGLRIGGATYPRLSNSDPEFSTDDAPAVGVTAGVRKGRLSLELSVDWMRSEFQQDVFFIYSYPPIIVLGSYLNVKGELVTVPIFLTGQFHLLKEGGPVDPYLGVGVGYLLNRFSPDRHPAVSIDFDDDTFGIQGALGAAFKVSPALAVTIDGRYLLARTKISFRNIYATPSLVHETVDFSGFVATVGVRYTFPPIHRRQTSGAGLEE